MGRSAVLCAVAALTLSPVVVPSESAVAACTGAVGAVLPTTPESRLQLAADPGAPLLVVFHGKNGCIGAVQGQSTLDTDQRGVSVLWLTGEGGVWDGWYEGADRTYAYVREALRGTYEAGATPSTVVAVGISMGAVMAMWAACMVDEFDGVVSIAGTARLSRCRNADLSLLVIGGAADASAGGAATPPALLDRWCEIVTGCGDRSVSEWGGVRSEVASAECGVVLRAVTLSGVGHVWPLLPLFNADDEVVRFARSIGFGLPGVL